MEKIPTWMCVVALAMDDGAGRWLMYRRPPNKHHGGLWEFPGGKVEPGEDPRTALVREIKEELNLSLSADLLMPSIFAQETHAKGRLPIVILLYKSTWDGSTASALEGGEIGWFTPFEVVQLDKPPLDVDLATRLLEKT